MIQIGLSSVFRLSFNAVSFQCVKQNYTLALHIGNLVVIIIVKTIIPKPSNLSQVA